MRPYRRLGVPLPRAGRALVLAAASAPDSAIRSVTSNRGRCPRTRGDSARGRATKRRLRDAEVRRIVGLAEEPPGLSREAPLPRWRRGGWPRPRLGSTLPTAAVSAP